jgi:hypothetical protein
MMTSDRKIHEGGRKKEDRVREKRGSPASRGLRLVK